jgi:hypothetical protein
VGPTVRVTLAEVERRLVARRRARYISALRHAFFSAFVQPPEPILYAMNPVSARRLVPLLAGVLLAGAAAADSFRCGNRLITDGDSAAKVLALCGEPSEVTTTSILRRPVVWRYGRPWYASDDLVPVAVEFWTYNLGRQKLMRRLRLEDGLVVEIETLGHGYHDDP